MTTNPGINIEKIMFILQAEKWNEKKYSSRSEHHKLTTFLLGLKKKMRWTHN